MEDLLQQLKGSELKNMKLSLENEALKVLMNNKDSKWRNGKTRMMAGIASLESELKNAKVVQRELESELREMGKRLIMKDKDIQSVNNPPKEPQAVIQRITEELREYKKKVEDVDREKDEVIATFQSEKTALVDENDELMAKLKTTQTQILQSETDCNLKVNFIENQLCSEQLENVVCVQRIKELESLVETTEKKWLNVQEDSQHKSQKIDEDLKFLIVKTIKFQELVLMSDRDKARRRKDERKAQKEEEKRVEKELKEKKKQEKREKKKREKELKEKKKQEKTEKKQREKEAKKQ